MNPSRPPSGVDRRTLLSSLTALPAFSLPMLASAARAQSASGQGGFSFAAVGDTRPMMYLPETSGGFVTLPCRERKVSAAQELLGRCDCGPPRGHRGTAKRAVRLGGDEMALDVEGVVDGGVG